MLDLVEQLKGFLLDGQVVYMHCWGGRGRAGTIASCFLASCYKLSAEETADRIQLAFDTRNDGGRRSLPSTIMQYGVHASALAYTYMSVSDGVYMATWHVS